MDDNIVEKVSDDIFTKGDELQKLSVIESLPSLMQIDTNATFNKVIPRIQQELARSSSEFSIATSRIFQVLIESHLRNDINIAQIVIQGIENKDPLVANAWLETLLEVTLILPMRIIQQEVLPVALQKGQCSQPIAFRVYSCRMIGKIVLHPQIKSLEIKKDILPIVYSLCQDVNYSVRAAICEQIPAIAKGLGTTMVKNFLLANLVELASDDNANVRAVAVSSVVQVLVYLDRETKIATMIPLIMNLFAPPNKVEDSAAVIIAKNMGLLLTSLENCLTVQQADSLINFYQHLARRGLDTKDLSVYNVDTTQDVKGREYCASNFPSVMSFTMAICPGNMNKLYEIFKALTFDSCYIVRLTIAGVFHEVARILGPKNNIMKTEFVRLLRDEAEEVLQMLVPHISTTLILFLNHGTLNLDRTDAVASEISKAMLKCFNQLSKGYNWRLTTLFLKQLETLPMVFRGEQIHNEFTPQIIRCALFGRTKPVRSQAVRTLLFFLRWNTKLIQRTWLRDHLVHELGENKCCYTRHVFIELCLHAIELFSNKYFKENFFLPLLRLSSDKVSTVRYSTVSVLPKLKRMIRLPQDRKLLTAFEQVVLTLEKNEKDRDVLSNLISKTKEMMVPVYSSMSEDSEAREKRLIEEEDNVTKGKVTFSVNTTNNYNPNNKNISNKNIQILNRSARSQSGSRESDKSSSATSSVSAQKSSGTPRASPTPPSPSPPKDNSDMTFLKQHFYIDAGVHLPIEETISKKLSNDQLNIEINDELNNLSISNAEYLNNSTTNMTDDIKVNLRRKKRFSEIPTAKNKRHSSVFTNSDIRSNNFTANKRRSLNIQSKDISKIPVILNAKVTGKCKIGDKDNKKIANVSNLPVPIRSSPTGASTKRLT